MAHAVLLSRLAVLCIDHLIMSDHCRLTTPAVNCLFGLHKFSGCCKQVFTGFTETTCSALKVEVHGMYCRAGSHE